MDERNFQFVSLARIADLPRKVSFKAYEGVIIDDIIEGYRAWSQQHGLKVIIYQYKRLFFVRWEKQ